MGKIGVGDFVIGSDGNPTRVVGVFPQGEKDVWEISLKDGATVQCSQDHLWNVRDSTRKSYRTVTTDFLAGTFVSSGKFRWRIPTQSPIRFDERKYFIDPYVLGVLIGDGNLRSTPSVTNVDLSVLLQLAGSLPEGYRMRIPKNDSLITYRIRHDERGHKFKRNAIRVELERLGLSDKRAWEKHIPEEYLFGSIQQRIDLLQGLMDTDGEVVAKGASVRYTTTSERLATDVIALVESLGCTINSVRTVRKKYPYKGEIRVGRTAWLIAFKVPEGIPPFRGSRSLRYVGCYHYKPVRVVSDVRNTHTKKEMTCIQVDAPDGLYVTSRFVLTHNTTLVKCASNDAGADLVEINASMEIDKDFLDRIAGQMKTAPLGKARFYLFDECDNMTTGQQKKLASAIIGCRSKVFLVCNVVKDTRDLTDEIKRLADSGGAVGCRKVKVEVSISDLERAAAKVVSPTTDGSGVTSNHSPLPAGIRSYRALHSYLTTGEVPPPRPTDGSERVRAFLEGREDWIPPSEHYLVGPILKNSGSLDRLASWEAWTYRYRKVGRRMEPFLLLAAQGKL